MKRHKHSLSNYKLLSCDLGELVPIGLTEVLPGDSIQQATNALVRAAPLNTPVMHPLRVSISHWFVPNRLIWENWEDFITGGPDGMDASEFPTIDLGGSGAAVGSLADYFGVPTGVPDLEVSALPFRAYALIYNEWYRDQDLTAELPIDYTEGADTTTSTALQNAAWEKDYFTASRPWLAKGPQITVPLGTRANVKGLGIDVGNPASGNTTIRETGETTETTDAIGSGGLNMYMALTGTAPDKWPDVYADLSSASAVTVDVLREALALQRYQEARARYGSRYSEYLNFLGVGSSDGRLQRPEYLGGGKETLQFSEVLQTAEGANPVGTLRGHGISSMRSNRYRRFFEEHGYIISLLTARPKTIYVDGLDRTWNRRTKEDFWQRELEHIGQQEVLNKELYAAHSDPEGTFGFSDRYSEYRQQVSTIAGEFRTIQNQWHFARSFAADPALNADFVKCVPTEVPFAVPSEDVLQIMARHNIQARRLVTANATSYIY